MKYGFRDLVIAQRIRLGGLDAMEQAVKDAAQKYLDSPSIQKYNALHKASLSFNRELKKG
jgi:hypothetical protein